MRTRFLGLLTFLTLVAAPLDAQTQSLAGGSLRVVNLYSAQGEILRNAPNQPRDSTIAQLVRAVYAPNRAFWKGYLGDEAAFRRWAVKLLAPDHPIHTELPKLREVGLDRLFEDGVAWIVKTTGRKPAGTWYLVFGPGWTDMGGLTGIGMVADFTRMRVDSTAIARLLPHELTHQVYGTPGDSAAGTVLHRLISEGFATYVTWIYGDGSITPAQALGYTPEQYAWAVQNERALYDAMKPSFTSRERKDSDRIASRSAHIIPGAPGAAGYFTGMRIVEAYVAKHGVDSWKDLYDMHVAEVLARSGYAAR